MSADGSCGWCDRLSHYEWCETCLEKRDAKIRAKAKAEGEKESKQQIATLTRLHAEAIQYQLRLSKDLARVEKELEAACARNLNARAEGAAEERDACVNAIEAFSSLRRLAGPPEGRSRAMGMYFHRWEGEQAGHSQALAIVRARGAKESK